MVEQKNHAFLLNALLNIVEVKEIELVLLGTGSLKKEIEKIDYLGLQNRVEIVGWSSVNPENYMNNAIAMLLSSKWEGMPNVLIEAMSYACPIISVDCPTGPREILGCSEHGILVSKDNKAGFVDAMLKVEKDKKFGINGL